MVFKKRDASFWTVHASAATGQRRRSALHTHVEPADLGGRRSQTRAGGASRRWPRTDVAPVLRSFRLAFIRCHPPVTLERMRDADANFCGLPGAPASLRGP